MGSKTLLKKPIKSKQNAEPNEDMSKRRRELGNGSEDAIIPTPQTNANILQPYSAKNSLTLTKQQASTGSFAIPNNWRAASNKTVHGFSTGYHESSVTTDSVNYLRQAKANDNNDNNRTHKLPAAKSGFFKVHSEQNVDSNALIWSLNSADSFRTDTSRTILSALNGNVAGHSGSNLDTKNQKDAHDLLRQAIMRSITGGKDDGRTEKSIACLHGAITSISIAPGEVARTINGGTSSLKDHTFKNNYEAARQEMKARVGNVYHSLTEDEQKFVGSHITQFITSLSSVGLATNRKLSSFRPTSPTRALTATGNEVSGGLYEETDRELLPTLSPPSDVRLLGMYMTDSFRAERRSFLAKPPSRSNSLSSIEDINRMEASAQLAADMLNPLSTGSHTSSPRGRKRDNVSPDNYGLNGRSRTPRSPSQSKGSGGK